MKRIKRVLKRVFNIKPVGRDICDNAANPTPRYEDGSWLTLETTPDQQKIEHYLSTLDLRDKRLLHVGIGNSAIGKTYATESTRVDGITVIEEEKNYADQLHIPSYKPYLINKYDENQLCGLNQLYDIVIDNNLSSFSCCRFHYKQMLRNYIASLTATGMILTEAKGMAFFEDYAFPIDFSDLQTLEEEYPVTCFTLRESMVAVQRLTN